MVTDSRGHEVPADSDMWGYREDMGLLSESIADVRSVANKVAAQAAVADLAADDIDTAGTVWWFANPGALYVFDGAEFRQLPFQDSIDVVIGRLPYAVAAGTGTMSVTGTKSATVTFPAGLFTVPPVVVAGPKTAYPENRSAVSAQSPTTTSVQIFMFYGGDASNLGYSWSAIQPAAAALLLTADEAPVADTTVTCPTAGCGNQGIPIEIASSWTDEDDVEHPIDAVECGVCGTDITDTMQPVEES